MDDKASQQITGTHYQVGVKRHQCLTERNFIATTQTSTQEPLSLAEANENSYCHVTAVYPANSSH